MLVLLVSGTICTGCDFGEQIIDIDVFEQIKFVLDVILMYEQTTNACL